MRTLVCGGVVLTPTDELADGWVLIEGDRIADLGRGPTPSADSRIDAAGRFVAPGFIDLHVQGIAGIDLWDPSDENYRRAAFQMARCGVTSFVASVDATDEVCRIMRPRIGRADGGARLLGLYFEAPLIAPARRGAIPPDRVQPVTADLADRILRLADGLAAIITVAPEQPGVLDLLPRIRRTRGALGNVVAAIGHTEATFDQATAGFRAGITHATHLYNAMNGLHHREPGAVGAVLTSPDVSAEVVCDGVHVHPAAVRVAVACKGPARTCLITDGVSARRGRIIGGAPRLDDGTIAGSVLTMDRAVANVRRFAGMTMREAVLMATLSPARVMGLDGERGRLQPGAAADLVVFDANVSVATTVVGGNIVWSATHN